MDNQIDKKDLLPIAQSTTKNIEPSLSIETYIHAATSDNTRKAYRQDIKHFIHWGGILPATPDSIIRYLQYYAAVLNSRTLTRRLTALKNWHVYQGFSDPTANTLVRKTLTGIKHIHGQPKEKASALTIEQLNEIVAFLKKQDSLYSLRNLAIMQVGFFGAFRRSELVGIKREHINFVPEGMEILIPRSKTDQLGDGQICAIPYGDELLCPVNAVIKWCEAADIQTGFIFRGFNKQGQILPNALTTQSINIIIKSLADQCGFSNAKQFSSHSLRRGFATAASRKGAPFKSIMRHGRWKHEGTVLGYIEEGQRFEENAAKIILAKE